MFQYGVIYQGKICYSWLNLQLRLDFCVCVVYCFQEISFRSSPGFDKCALYTIANCYTHYFMNLPSHLLLKLLMIVYKVLFARSMSNRPSAEKIEKPQTLREVVSEFIQTKSPFEPHPKVIYVASYTNLALLSRYAGSGFFQFSYLPFNEMYNSVIH